MKAISQLLRLVFRQRGADPLARAFAKRFGIEFKNPSLLRVALTHRSSLGEDNSEQSNERLEFLGDAVLDLIASDYFYHAIPEGDEGELTKARSRLVNKNMLGEIGFRLGILEFVDYAKEEIERDERALVTISADAVEAVIGAIYLDSGYQAAYKFVLDHIVGLASSAAERQIDTDYKSRLQEMCQATLRVRPDYKTVAGYGPEHRKIFHVNVVINGKVYGRGSGRSKKEAEQDAAREALKKLSHRSDRQDNLKSLDTGSGGN